MSDRLVVIVNAVCAALLAAIAGYCAALGQPGWAAVWASCAAVDVLIVAVFTRNADSEADACERSC